MMHQTFMNEDVRDGSIPNAYLVQKSLKNCYIYMYMDTFVG